MNWVKGSASRGSREVSSLFLGEEIGPFGIVILLAISAIVIGVGWYYLDNWHLITGIVFFMFGLGITWLLLKLGVNDRIQSGQKGGYWVYIFPFIAGPIGWLLEHFELWKIGSYFTIDLKLLGIDVPDLQVIAIPVNILLTIIVTACVVMQTLGNRQKRRRR